MSSSLSDPGRAQSAHRSRAPQEMRSRRILPFGRGARCGFARRPDMADRGDRPVTPLSADCAHHAAQDAARLCDAPDEAHELQGDRRRTRRHHRHRRLSYGAGACALPRGGCGPMVAGAQLGHAPDPDIGEIRRGSAAVVPDSPLVTFEAFYRAETEWVLRSAGHTSELQSLMRISYDVF